MKFINDKKSFYALKNKHVYIRMYVSKYDWLTL